MNELANALDTILRPGFGSNVERDCLKFPRPDAQCRVCGIGPCRFAPRVPRKGDWMQTSLGNQFWPLDPRIEEIHIEDIAAALAKLCRYGGHCKRFYSVAEHCVLMAAVAPPAFALAALMHDASEAYLADVIRPIKRYLTNYKPVEAELERCIACRFSLPWPMPSEVKVLDERIIADEQEQVMLPAPAEWAEWERVAPLGVRLEFWTPEKAEFEFLAAFRRYGGHWTSYFALTIRN